MERMSSMTTLMAFLVSAGLLVAGAVRAEEGGLDNQAVELQRFAATKMSLAQAIAAAEAEVGGKAMSAEIRGNNATGDRFEVEIPTGDGTVTLAAVDPADGSVQVMLLPEDQAGGDEDDDEAR